MKWWLAGVEAGVVAGAITAAGCSNLPTNEGGIAGLEIRVPRPAVVEVGQTIQLHARALDARGDSVAAPVRWLTPDTTVTLTTDGKLTGRTGGSTAQVQAQSASIVSDFVSFTVNARPDTIVITGDSVLVVAAGAAASTALLASLRSFDPAGPLSGRIILYRIVAPVFADPAQRTIELPGGVLAVNAETGADGTPATAVTVNRISGRTAPDSAIVTVSAATATGAVVAGSGQRFIVRFQ
jgi:hypothetical protein